MGRHRRGLLLLIHPFGFLWPPGWPCLGVRVEGKLAKGCAPGAARSPDFSALGHEACTALPHS